MDSFDIKVAFDLYLVKVANNASELQAHKFEA